MIKEWLKKIFLDKVSFEEHDRYINKSGKDVEYFLMITSLIVPIIVRIIILVFDFEVELAYRFQYVNTIFTSLMSIVIMFCTMYSISNNIKINIFLPCIMVIVYSFVNINYILNLIIYRVAFSNIYYIVYSLVVLYISISIFILSYKELKAIIKEHNL